MGVVLRRREKGDEQRGEREGLIEEREKERV